MPYREILTPLIQRLIRLVGLQTASELLREVPGLSIDAKGNVLDYDTDAARGTITKLVDIYEAASHMIATEQAAQNKQTNEAEASSQLFHADNALLQPVKILLVDDHALVLEGLASLIEPQTDMQVVGQAGTVSEAIRLAHTLRPDIILMDFTLPDGKGDEATRVILSALPDTKIVFLTVHDDDERLFAAIAAGAIGYLLKSVRSADLLSRLRAVARGDIVLSPSIGRRVLEKLSHQSEPRPAEHAPIEELSERELEIFTLIVQGFTNRQIAGALSLSVRTVEYHRSNLMDKLGLHNRADLVRFATDHGLFQSTDSSHNHAAERGSKLS
jgi:DNA-binding NarL/FixJ family response regulator